MRVPLLRILCFAATSLVAVDAPKFPKLNDPALKLEAFATAPDIEVPTTVCAAPDGSVYIGCDPRDARLNTDQPEDYIVRYSSLGPDRKRTVFADKIYSPAGSQWHDGWLYVLHDPYLTRFKDSTGDGVADVREDLITNLGVAPNPGLNDHVVSGFVLGMDGFFYISVGDRGIYKAHGKDGSELSLQGGGIIRCRPDGTQLEVFSTGTRNHLAVLLDAEDNAFTRDNTDDGNGWWTRLTHHIEGGYYGYPYDYRHAKNYGVTEPSKQTLDAIKQHSPDEDLPTTERFLPAMADFGSGSPTGGLCYLSDGLPEPYRGKLMFTEWGKGALFVTEVARAGATFKLVSDTKLIEAEKGSDFRPMQINVAPDGSLLIADWGFGGWKAPKTVGTVWRLSWPEAKPSPRLADESKATVDELIAALGHMDRDQRLRAQGALVEKGESVIAKLAAVLNADTSPRIHRLHALWTLENIMGPRCLDFQNRYTDEKARVISAVEKAILGVAAHGDDGLRAQVMRALAYRRTWFACDPVADLARKLSASSDAVVRLQAIAAMGRMSHLDLPLLAAKSLHDSDPTVAFGAQDSLRKLISTYGIGAYDLDSKALAKPSLDVREWEVFSRPQLDQSVESSPGRVVNGNDGSQQEILGFLIDRATGKTKATDRARAVRALAQFAYDPLPYDGHWWGTQPVKSAAPLNSVAWQGTTRALDALSGLLADADKSIRLAAAKGFGTFLLDTQGAEALAALRTRLTVETDVEVRQHLIEALGVQRDPQAMDVFMKIALDEKADADFRATAIGAVVNIGGDGAKKTIAQLAAAPLSPAATRKVIQAAGELKVLDAAPALIRHLNDADVANRELAAKALGQLGAKSGATPALIAALADKESKVLQAVVDALGSLRDKAALPALIEFAKKKRARKELLNALSAMPDLQSIPVLVGALDEKSSGTRRNVLGALAKLRGESWPLIEHAIAAGKVPPEFVPEIRMFFDRGPIAKWRLLGPFENVWGAVHPPENDIAAKDLLTRRYKNAEGQEVGWIDATVSSDDARVDLEKIFHTNGMVCAYAVADIEADAPAEAKLLCGSDDQMAVWLNGVKVHDSGSGSRGFNPDQDTVTLHLTGGTNRLFVKIGNASGSWIFAGRIPGLEGDKFSPSKEPPPEEKQRAFALVAKGDGSWEHPGSRSRGEKIFADPNGPIAGICATCHKVRGFGGDIGPDLSLVGSVYKRADLLTSILEPSKTIALGFEQVMVETTGGETFLGALRQETADALTVKGADGQPHIVRKMDVKKLDHIPTSLMPPGLTLALKPEELVDLLAYLESLKGN